MVFFCSLGKRATCRKREPSRPSPWLPPPSDKLCVHSVTSRPRKTKQSPSFSSAMVLVKWPGVRAARSCTLSLSLEVCGSAWAFPKTIWARVLPGMCNKCKYFPWIIFLSIGIWTQDTVESVDLDKGTGWPRQWDCLFCRVFWGLFWNQLVTVTDHEGKALPDMHWKHHVYFFWKRGKRLRLSCCKLPAIAFSDWILIPMGHLKWCGEGLLLFGIETHGFHGFSLENMVF